jgi:hypothetical protein
MNRYPGFVIYFQGREIYIHASTYSAEVKGGEIYVELFLEKKKVARFFGKELGVLSLEDQPGSS